MPTISAYTVDEVRDYFERHFPRPSWPMWLGRLNESLRDVGPIKVGPWKVAFRDATEEPRYRLATWRWLRPSAPIPALKDLRSIQAIAGLEHVPAATFAARVAERAADVARDHPDLARWIERRMSLIEFIADPPLSLPEPLKAAPLLLRNALLSVHHIWPRDPETARAGAEQILAQAMVGAASAASSAFNAKEPHVAANLMIRMPHDREFGPSSLARENAGRALRLWGPQRPGTKRLVVVAETDGSDHLGFWIPLCHGLGGSLLPGAATAYEEREGHAVFKDDLPPLTGFPLDVGERWRDYMLRDFREMLFFSIPFRAPTFTGNRFSAAVLNVNVAATDVAPWRRAYHPEWLCAARDRAEPFLEVAYAAVRITFSNVDGRFLDSGSAQWDRLPLAVPRRLTGGE